MDKIEYLGKSLIQHGAFNNRIFLMKLHKNDFPEILPILNRIAGENGYTKIFAKIPARFFPEFNKDNYRIEACIPRFFNGMEDAFFIAKYFDSKRGMFTDNPATVQQILLSGPQKKDIGTSVFPLRELDKDDVENITGVFKQVFASYPFPIFESKYILKTQKEGVRYFGAFDGDNLIAVSTAEIDTPNSNAEMTDFAVLPEYRGYKLALHLLKKMEEEMQKSKIKTLYTIARFQSPSMNKTFLNNGYTYSGTLVNNTQIAGHIESMNIWYKHI